MEDDLITVGIVRGVRGLKGQLRIESMSDFPGRFAEGQVLELDGHKRAILRVAGDRKGLILELEGIHTRECAEKFKDCELRSTPYQSENLISEGSYFHHEIIGMEVRDQNNRDLGRIKEIIETGANDVYVVSNSSDKDILIPAISSIICEVRVDINAMRINLPVGLNTRT